MTQFASQEGAQRRRDNFMRDTMREPEAGVAHDSLEEQALMLLRASLEADALSNRRDLLPADMDRMLSVAKGKLRGMSERELRGISASSATLKVLTDYSLSAAPIADLRTPAAIALAAERDKAVADGGTTFAARMLRLDQERAERAESSARYDGLGGGERLSQSDLQNMAAARAAAQSYGMSWALNNPDLLKLGAGAIKTLHDAGVQKERFERMTGDKVGFRAATAVEIAAFAKRHNLTPDQTNRLYDKISDGVEIISGGNKAIQRELDEATRRYVTGTDTPETRKALEDAYKKHADTPEKKRAAEEAPKALFKAASDNSAAVVALDTAKARNAADIASETSLFDAPADAGVTKKQTDAAPLDEKGKAAKTVDAKSDEKKVAPKPANPKLS